MSNEKKKIGGALLAVIIVLAIIVSAVVYGVSAYISAANSGAQIEANIKMLNSNSENVLSAVTTNIKEQAGITNVYAKDFQDSLTAAMSGRYGSDGSKAAMQWIKEQNPALDSSIYGKVQDIINGGRKEFQTSQTRKLEVCRDYDARLKFVVGGFFLRLAGYPTIDLKDTCKVVSDASSRQAFETGLNVPITFQRSSGK